MANFVDSRLAQLQRNQILTYPAKKVCLEALERDIVGDPESGASTFLVFNGIRAEFKSKLRKFANTALGPSQLLVEYRIMKDCIFVARIDEV
jgi:hypothetical protein